MNYVQRLVQQWTSHTHTHNPPPQLARYCSAYWGRICLNYSPTAWADGADRRGEGLRNGHCRTYSATILKALLNNTLKCAQMCQTLLVGENEKNNPEDVENPAARELCTRQAHQVHSVFLELFAVQLSNCRQTFHFQPFTAYSHVKNPLWAHQKTQIAWLYILANLSPHVGRNNCYNPSLVSNLPLKFSFLAIPNKNC